MSSALPKRSVYAAPAALVRSIEYARRLVDELGVDCFIVRTGFHPSEHDASLARAVEQVRAFGIGCWLLVGTWWGHGFEPGEEAMVGVADDLIAGGYRGHESQWRMASPGGRTDDAIEASLRHLCEQLGPDAVLLTHARYRHAAAIGGLFEVGGESFRSLMHERGLSQRDLRHAVKLVIGALVNMDPVELAGHARDRGLAQFLDSLSGTDVFSRWFDLRAELVTRSITRFRSAVKSVRPDARFGTNAVGPVGAFESGQSYAALVEQCDVIQPLLGYVYWHVWQTVSAWQQFLSDRVQSISSGAAWSVAAALFGLTGVDIDPEWRSEVSDTTAPPHLIDGVVRRQLALLEEQRDRRRLFTPVLNAGHWPAATVRDLTAVVDTSGYPGVAYQGTASLVHPVTGDGWN